MKIFTLRNFIFLIIIVVILHQVMSRIPVPIMIPMENINPILCSYHPREIPSYINMDFTSRQAVIPQFPPGPPNPILQPNYLLYATLILISFEGGLLSTAVLQPTINIEPYAPFLTVVSLFCGCSVGFLLALQIFH